MIWGHFQNRELEIFVAASLVNSELCITPKWARQVRLEMVCATSVRC